MKRIYIVDEFKSSQKNGIGTYIDELLYCLKGNWFEINLISFNTEEDEFCIIKQNEVTRYLFPVFGNGAFLDFPQITKKFFSLYIPDSTDNVFFINHSPCSVFILSLRESHPKSKVVFVIHDFGWTRNLMGDLLRAIAFEMPYLHSFINII